MHDHASPSSHCSSAEAHAETKFLDSDASLPERQSRADGQDAPSRSQQATNISGRQFGE